MSKDEIRVQYSGFIIFAAQILSLVTGIVFTLLLTRNMTEQQFGIWSNFFDYTGYFTLLSGLVPFWATRFVARRKEGTTKTSLLANSVMAIVAMGIYLPVISSIAYTIHTEAYLIVYLVAALQILNVYLISSLEGCLRSVKPQAVGYGLLIEEVTKVSLALVLIVGLNQLFLGAMLSLTIAALIQALYYLRLLAEDLKQRTRWNYIKEWLKGSTMMVYSAIGNQLGAFVFILLFLYGGQAARGEYQAAATFANIIGYSSSLSFALYPKILAKDCLDDVALSLKTMLMLAIPMTAIVITLSKSFLTILNVSYGVASPVLVLLALGTPIVLISQFYSSLLMGMERFDEEGKISLSKLVRSKLFKVFTVPYIQAAFTLPIAYYVLTQLALGGSVQAVSYVIIINIVVNITTFIGLYALMRRSVRMFVAWRSVGKYILASLVAVAVLYLLPQTTTIIATFGKVAVGAATYAAFLLATDADARELVTQIWTEIRGVLGNVGKEMNLLAKIVQRKGKSV